MQVEEPHRPAGARDDLGEHGAQLDPFAVLGARRAAFAGRYSSAACAAASRAMGTRNGEQLT